MRFLFLLAACCQFHISIAQCIFTLRGVVQDAATGEALPGATLRIAALRQSQVADAKGQFSFSGICPGEYDLQVDHASCETRIIHIHITTDWNGTVALPHKANTLSEVIVTGRNRSAGSSASTTLQGAALAAVKGSSLGESLRQIAGVSVLQTGTNIYKPVIQGLHSNRILILNNGIRQEGQQWGSEHAPEVDPYIANRITVIKGAGALRYGSDAIGGVVLVEPKLLPFVPGLSGEVNVAAFSNNRMGVLSGQIEGNSKKHPAFAWRLQGSFRRGGYARTPSYWLQNSSTEEYNFSAAAGWREEKRGLEFFYSQFNTRLGIFSGAHIGNTTDLINAINNGDPPDYVRESGFSYFIDRPYQRVQHQLFKAKAFLQRNKYSRLSVVLSGQWNHREEYDKKRFQSSSNTPQLDLRIGTVGTEVLYDHFAPGKLKGTLGASVFYQNNGYQYRLFIPNYEALQAGVFWVEKWEKGNWTLDGGLRFDQRRFYNTRQNNGKPYPERSYSNLSGSLGFQYRMAANWQLSFNASSAWRAPQVNELYTDGLHHGAARIEKGDSLLNPERALNFQLTLTHHNDRVELELTGYRKYITDFIFLKPSYPPQLTIRGAFPAFRYSQTDALLTGSDLQFQYRFTPHWSAGTKATLLWARDRTAKDWLIQMPPNRYELYVQYALPDGKKRTETYIKIQTVHTEQQTRVPATGNIEITQPNGSIVMASDYAPPPPAFTLLGLEAGTRIVWGQQPFYITLGAANLLNTTYRDYMNAFRYFSDEMGRNVSVRVRMPIGARGERREARGKRQEARG